MTAILDRGASSSSDPTYHRKFGSVTRDVLQLSGRNEKYLYGTPAWMSWVNVMPPDLIFGGQGHNIHPILAIQLPVHVP
jgi:hypothetical protein